MAEYLIRDTSCIFSPFLFGLRAMARVVRIRDLVYDEGQNQAAAPYTLCSQRSPTVEM